MGVRSGNAPAFLDLEPPSFVNGIRTDQGGEFVDVVTQPLFQKLVKHVRRRRGFASRRRITCARCG